jgi:outer membrane protein OmpA-like peptidoglycan-associated protein
VHRPAPVIEPPVPTGEPVPALPTRSYTYQLLEPEATGLAQVFDDGHRTYLTFLHAPPAGMMIFDESGRAVPFITGNGSAIVSAVRPGLLIRTPTKSSYAQAGVATQGGRATANTAGAPESAAAYAMELASARAGILRAEQRIGGLSAEIDQAERSDPSVSLGEIRSEIEQVQIQLNGVRATLLRTHFASGSTVLVLSDRAQEAIIAAAQRADQVRIRGRTDSTGSPTLNADLALGRAVSMRRFLIAGGVPAGKLRTSYAEADYIASNATPEGRAQNRRVDVVLVGRYPEPMSSAETSNVDRSNYRLP